MPPHLRQGHHRYQPCRVTQTVDVVWRAVGLPILGRYRLTWEEISRIRHHHSARTPKASRRLVSNVAFWPGLCRGSDNVSNATRFMFSIRGKRPMWNTDKWRTRGAVGAHNYLGGDWPLRFGQS